MKRFLIVLLIVFLMASTGGVYYYYEYQRIPAEVEQGRQALMDEIGHEYVQKVSVWRVREGKSLPKMLELDQTVIDENLELVTIPVVAAPDETFSDITLMTNTTLLESIGSKEIVTINDFVPTDFVYEDYNRLETYPTNDNLGGLLKKGVIVDIEVVYGNGDYDVVLPKIQIVDVVSHLDQNGTISPGYDYKYDVMVSVENEEDIRDMALAVLRGELNLRAYHDIEQKASLKTFDYDKQLEHWMIGQNVVTDKTQLNDEQVTETKVED